MTYLYDTRATAFAGEAGPGCVADTITNLREARSASVCQGDVDLTVNTVSAGGEPRWIGERCQSPDRTASILEEFWKHDAQCKCVTVEITLQAESSNSKLDEDWSVVCAWHRLPVICALRQAVSGRYAEGALELVSSLYRKDCWDTVSTECYRTAGVVLGRPGYLYLEGKLRRLDDPCKWPSVHPDVVASGISHVRLLHLVKLFDKNCDMRNADRLPMHGRRASAFLRAGDMVLLQTLGEERMADVIESMSFSLESWLAAT